MQIQVNTDAHINGDADLAERVETTIRATFDRFNPQITRVEAFLSDSNGHKGGDRDIRCVLEARMAGMDPVVGTHQAAEIESALDGAIGKVEKQLDKTLDRQGHKKGRTSYGGEPSD